MAHEHSKEYSSDHYDEKEITVWSLIGSGILLVFGLIAEHTPLFAEGSFLVQKFSLTPQITKSFYLAMYFASYAVCGLPVLKEAVEKLLHRDFFEEEFLMSVASVGALCIGETAESVAVMFLFQLGEYLEDKAVDKSEDSIAELMNIRPDKATVIRNGKEEELNAEEIKPGETIIVRPGERIALDGTVAKGTSFIDTSALTGESVPREVNEGDEVLSGCINTSGIIEITVTKLCSDSAASRILDLIENAQEKKAKSEQFITRFSRIYTPIVIILAIIVATVPPLLIHGQTFKTWLYRGLMFLVVSCPCALVISVPLSFVAALGKASRKGILIKGASFIEKLSRINTVVFDKTGTLTKGIFAVTGIHTADERFSKEELLAVAAHAEYFSNHPISRSLKEAHHCDKCSTVSRDNSFEEISGQGIKTVIDGKNILAGNMRLMEEQKVTDLIECNEDDTGTIVHIAIDGIYAGHIVISDELKDESENAISLLKKAGVKKTVLLTGDSESSAEKVARILKMDSVFSELLPGDKVTQLEKLLEQNKSSKNTLAFVGDGINDAPVITRADIGFSMGALGSDAAIEAADVVLMDDKPTQVAEAITLSKKTMRVVWENIIFSLSVKVVIMILSALGITDMWIAVFGDVGITLLAIANTLRLLAL